MYWTVAGEYNDYFADTSSPNASSRNPTLCGDKDAFYFMPAALNQVQKQVYGAGIYDDALGLWNPWFLMSYLDQTIANLSRQFEPTLGGQALTTGDSGSAFLQLRIVFLKNAC